MSTFTSAIDLELVARGDDVGTWDTPTNANWTVVDKAVGGVTTISLNNSNVILSAAQFQASLITFNSTLTGTCFITFPTSFTKSYAVQNLCTGSSAFTVVLQTASTAAGIQGIGVPPGQTVDVFNDGSNMKFKNLPPVGTYMDFANSSNPLWNTTCTVPPWLACDGSTFSAVTYPALAVALGGTTLPDLRGRSRFFLNGGTSRITTAISGIDGDTKLSAGGDQNSQVHSHGVIGDTGTESAAHHHTATIPSANTTTGGGAFPCAGPIAGGVATSDETATHVHHLSFQSQNAFTGGSNNMPPAQISGISMIRAG